MLFTEKKSYMPDVIQDLLLNFSLYIENFLNLILLYCWKKHFPANSLFIIIISPEESEGGMGMM